jgi:cytochrome c oxidase cbb3-type subunit 3
VRRLLAGVFGVIATVAAIIGIIGYAHRSILDAELVERWPSDVTGDSRLTDHAIQLAAPTYAAYCARCHGTLAREGTKGGAPFLFAGPRLHGDGSVAQLERTILYGIRSGHPKARGLTEMPAFGRTHRLTTAQIGDVVEYLILLRGESTDQAAAERGRAIFGDKGDCFDCHGYSGTGNFTFGAPSLVTGPTLYGASRSALFDSIYSGRHGQCPAWIGRLTFVQIRALATFLYVEAQ